MNALKATNPNPNEDNPDPSFNVTAKSQDKPDLYPWSEYHIQNRFGEGRDKLLLILYSLNQEKESRLVCC